MFHYCQLIIPVFLLLALSSTGAPIDNLDRRISVSLTDFGHFVGNDGPCDLDMLVASVSYSIGRHRESPYQLSGDAARASTVRDTVSRNSALRPNITTARPNLISRAVAQMGNLELSEYNNYAGFRGLVYIGNPPQAFWVQFDTGSGDMFVPGPDCASDVNCRGRNLFQLGRTVREVSDKVYPLGFGASGAPSADVTVKLYSDSVIVGGVISKKQTFGLASRFSPNLSVKRLPVDGVVGLAFPSTSRYGVENLPFIFKLISERRIYRGVFGFRMATTGDEPYLRPQLTLGALQPLSYKDPLHRIPVSDPEERHWQIPLDYIHVGGLLAVATSVQAIVDTGCPHLIGDHANVKAIYDLIPGAERLKEGLIAGASGMILYRIPCDNTVVVSLGFGKRSFKIKPETLKLGYVPGGKANDCVGGIIAGEKISRWLVGMVFLRNVYAAFDIDEYYVGFAELA